MPPIDLNTFHSAIQNLRGNDTVVVLGQNKKTGATTLSGLKPSKSGKVDGLETRQAFFNALVQGGSSEDYLKATYKKLGLDDQTKAHAPLTVQDIKTHLDERSEKGLAQFKAQGIKVGAGETTVDGFAIPSEASYGLSVNDFVIVEKKANVQPQATLFDHNDADQVRDADLQQRRDMLCTSLKVMCKVNDAQLQRLDVAGLKKLLAWVKKDSALGQDPKEVQRQVDSLSVSAHKVNQDELLTSVKRLETDPDFANKVKIEDKAKATSKASSLQNLLADLVLDSDTVLHDTLSPEARMLATLGKHKSAVLNLLSTDLDECLKTLPPLMASMAKQVKEKLAEFFGYTADDFEKLQRDIEAAEKAKQAAAEAAEKAPKKGIFENLLGAIKDPAFLKDPKLKFSMEMSKRIDQKLSELKTRLDNNETVAELRELDDMVGNLVIDRCDKLQSVMSKVFEGVVVGKNVDMTGLLDQLDPESIEIVNEYYPDVLPKGVGQSQDVKVDQQPGVKSKEAEEVEGYVNCKKYQEWSQLRPNEQYEKYQQLTSPDDRLATILSVWANNFRNDEALHRVIDILKTKEEQALVWKSPLPMSDQQIINQAENIAKEYKIQLTKEKPVVDQPAEPNDQDPLAKLRNTSLDDIANKGALDPDQGYGKFVLDTMKSYFKSVDPIDRRAMYASMIRNSPTCMDAYLSVEQAAQEPQVGTFDVNVNFNDKVKNTQQADPVMMIAASTLGAFFKGAGPVMQKTLQQLSSMDIPEALKLALVDMRSNLLPMPDKTVQAMLAKLVDDSHGEIKQITAKETMGAASVAQSILCEIEDKDGVKREVVVKLVRPDAAYRADREKQVFLDAAGDDEGMRSTFQGRLQRIMEEFDLEIETSNAKLGKIYDKQSTLHDRDWEHGGRITQSEKFADVQAVKIDKVSPPGSHTAMIMERASGKTLDKTIEYFDNAIKASQRKWNQLRSTPALNTPENINKFILANHQKLVELHDRMVAVKQKTLHFSHQWMNEAIYGSGFFHGDAHAGNLMLDEQKLTAIDFGNATLLSAREQKLVLSVIMACYNEKSDKFLTSFRELLSEQGRAQFDAKRDQVEQHINILMQKKKDAGDSKIGTLIAATIVELQKLEIEIPAPIFNFSYSQIMLQTTLDGLDTKIAELRQHLEIIAAANNPERNAAELQRTTELLANYQVDKDSAVHAQVSKFLLDDALKLEFDGFDAEMTKLKQEYPDLQPHYLAFVRSQAYTDCKNFAGNRDTLNVLQRICEYGYDTLSVEGLEEEDIRVQGEMDRLDGELAATANSKRLLNSQKIRRMKRLQAELDRTALRKRDIDSLRREIRIQTGTYEDSVKAKCAELTRLCDDFKRNGKDAFDEARRDFGEFYVKMRKTVIEGEKRKLERQTDHLAEVTKGRQKLKAVRPKTKSEIRKDERTFLSVMASNIYDHKFKALCSMFG